MFETLKKLNPNVPLFHVESAEFKTFGKIIDLDIAELMEEAKKIPNPETGSSYQPSVEAFETLAVKTQIQNECYGSQPTQMGHCWGHSSFLNGCEWHASKEINVATTPLVLFLAHVWDMEDSKIDSSKFTAFYLPQGTAVEIYATTLHFCPCEVTKDGFGCVVGLPAGTNTDLTITEKEPTLFRKNKWVVAHVENEGLLSRGMVPGITGTNLEIKY